MSEKAPQWAEALFNRIDQMHQQIEGMQKQIEGQQAYQDAEGTPTTSPKLPSGSNTEETPRLQAERSSPTKKLGPLAEYSGDREGLESWISQAHAKLLIDYAGCDEATMFFMLHNKLRGEAARQLQPWVQAVVNTTQMSARNLITQLELSFGDPHQKEKAQRKLHKMRQNQRSFMEYFTEFRKLVLEAGGTNWPDTIKKSYLEAGLNHELQRSMIGQGSNMQSFEDYCTELKRVSDQLEAFNLRNRNLTRTSYHLPSSTTKSYYGNNLVPRRAPSPVLEKMDWEPTNATKVAQGRRAKWVNQEELQKRKEKGDCYRCGASDHRVLLCPYQKAVRPRAIARTQPKREPILDRGFEEIGEVERDDVSTTDSEN